VKVVSVVVVDGWSLRRETFLPQESSPNIAAAFNIDLASAGVCLCDGDSVDGLCSYVLELHRGLISIFRAAGTA